MRFDNNKYSVSAGAVGRPVDIHAFADRVVIRQDVRIVAEHPRCYGRGETIYDPWHRVPVLARKPGALRNGAPFKDWVLPAALDRVRRKLAGSNDGDRQMVKILAAVLTDGLLAVEAACLQAFIEVMPLGEIETARIDQHLPLTKVRARLARHFTLQETDCRTGGPARYVRVVETGGLIGFITPLTHNFCEACNRVWVTCTGRLYMCLGKEDAADLRTPLRASEGNDLLRMAIRNAVARKPKGHDFVIDRTTERPAVARHMSATWCVKADHLHPPRNSAATKRWRRVALTSCTKRKRVDLDMPGG